MKIEHSPLINDFITFYMETRVDGQLRYQTWLYYWPDKKYQIEDMRTGTRSEFCCFEDESTAVSEIKARVESLIYGSQEHPGC